MLENIGLRSWQYRPIAARSLQKQLYINIPQYGLNKQKLVYYVIYHMALIIMHQTCLNLRAFANKNTWLLYVSLEAVHMAKS